MRHQPSGWKLSDVCVYIFYSRLFPIGIVRGRYIRKQYNSAWSQQEKFTLVLSHCVSRRCKENLKEKKRFGVSGVLFFCYSLWEFPRGAEKSIWTSLNYIQFQILWIHVYLFFALKCFNVFGCVRCTQIHENWFVKKGKIRKLNSYRSCTPILWMCGRDVIWLKDPIVNWTKQWICSMWLQIGECTRIKLHLQTLVLYSTYQRMESKNLFPPLFGNCKI